MPGGCRQRRHIHHHQLPDGTRMRQREFHRGLPSHRMAHNESGSEALLLKEFVEVRSHRFVRMHPVMRRPAMVALIHQVDLECLPQLPPERIPIIQRAEQAVQDDHRFAFAIRL